MSGHVSSWPGPEHKQGSGHMEERAQVRFTRHGNAVLHLSHEAPALLCPQPKPAAASFTPLQLLALWPGALLGLFSRVAGGGVFPAS